MPGELSGEMGDKVQCWQVLCDVCWSRQDGVFWQIDSFLNKRIIKEVTELRYLGITLNKNLKPESHILTIINGAMRILGLLKSMLYHAEIKTEYIAYKTLCRPLLEYSSAAWDPYLKKNIDSLEMVKNRAVRFIAGQKGMVSKKLPSFLGDLQMNSFFKQVVSLI